LGVGSLHRNHRNRGTHQHTYVTHPVLLEQEPPFDPTVVPTVPEKSRVMQPHLLGRRAGSEAFAHGKLLGSSLRYEQIPTVKKVPE
jgi:hypothetical protein